jgi:hypothetical protein
MKKEDTSFLDYTLDESQMVMKKKNDEKGNLLLSGVGILIMCQNSY